VSSVVLDASAILAVAFQEKGKTIVMNNRSNAIVSAVNHVEVVSKLLRFGMPLEEIDIFLCEAFPNVVAFDKQQADLAGQFHNAHRSLSLSYADCSSLALAKSHGLPVLTGDQKWATLALEVEVRLIR
jgi:ribonuclease VapC